MHCLGMLRWWHPWWEQHGMLLRREGDRYCHPKMTKRSHVFALFKSAPSCAKPSLKEQRGSVQKGSTSRSSQFLQSAPG